jgi:DedD protein
MRLPFLRSPDPSAPAGDDAVAAARTQARRRLVGALVLLVVGVIVFPLLFETQPRPVAVDTPIVTAREAALPAPPAPRPVTATPRPLPPDAGVEAQGAASAPVASTSPAAAASVPAVAPPAAAERVAAKPSSAASQPAVAASKPAPVRGSDGERARALLQGKATATPATPATTATATTAVTAAAAASPSTTAPETAGRFVVQVGAFTDPATLREARARVEKLGLKTYTQVIEGDAGKRTRVRVGPFATREEANAAAARLKAAGLPGNVLAL